MADRKHVYEYFGVKVIRWWDYCSYQRIVHITPINTIRRHTQVYDPATCPGRDEPEGSFMEREGGRERGRKVGGKTKGGGPAQFLKVGTNKSELAT